MDAAINAMTWHQMCFAMMMAREAGRRADPVRARKHKELDRRRTRSACDKLTDLVRRNRLAEYIESRRRAAERAT